MRFDINDWAEIATGETLPVEGGFVRVIASAPVNVYASNGVSEVLIGFGQEVRRELSNATEYRVEGPKGVRVFCFWPYMSSIRAEGEVLTNLERMPMESGNLYEVKKATRKAQLEISGMLKQMREMQRQINSGKLNSGNEGPQPSPEAEESKADVDDKKADEQAAE